MARKKKSAAEATAEIRAFCEKHNLTEAQFYGREKIEGSLGLNGLTSIPEGFNPTVGGSLGLNGLTSIPEGFNPTVGGDLGLNGLTSIPEGFNPTVGGYLWLNGLTRAKRAKVKTREPEPNLHHKLTAFREKMSWQNGKYIKVDGVFSELVSHKGNIYRTRQIGKECVEYLVTDNKGKWAHGSTLKEARADLVYKIGNRDTSEYKALTIDSILSFEKAVEVYRVITGACATGTRGFVESLSKVNRQYTVREIIEITKGRYGHNDFAAFFAEAGK